MRKRETEHEGRTSGGKGQGKPAGPPAKGDDGIGSSRRAKDESDARPHAKKSKPAPKGTVAAAMGGAPIAPRPPTLMVAARKTHAIGPPAATPSAGHSPSRHDNDDRRDQQTRD